MNQLVNKNGELLEGGMNLNRFISKAVSYVLWVISSLVFFWMIFLFRYAYLAVLDMVNIRWERSIDHFLMITMAIVVIGTMVYIHDSYIRTKWKGFFLITGIQILIITFLNTFLEILVHLRIGHLNWQDIVLVTLQIGIGCLLIYCRQFVPSGLTKSKLTNTY